MEKNLKIYTGQAAKILNYLKGGCTQAQAALATATTEGYVSQLCAEEDFQAQIAKVITADFKRAIETDENYEEVEHILSKKLREMAPMILNLDDALKTSKIVNSMKRKMAPAINPNQGGQDGNKFVTLVLPQVVINNIQNNFITNPNNEVVQVGDMDMLTLNSNSIDGLAAQVNDKQLAQIQTEPVPKIEFSRNGVTVEQRKDKYANL